MAKASRVAARQAQALEAVQEQLDRIEAKLDEVIQKQDKPRAAPARTSKTQAGEGKKP